MKALLTSNRYRYFHDKLLLYAIVSVAATAFINVAIISLIMLVAPILPSEMFEPLYANGYYNFGVLRIEKIDDLFGLTAEQLMSSAFLGGFLAVNVSVFIPLYICNSFKSGAVQNAYIRGNSKIVIFTAYIISAIEFFLAVFIIYILSLLLFSAILMETVLSSSMIANCLPMFTHQFFAHIAFLVLCVSAAFILRKALSCVISLLTSVLAFPIFLSTVDLILQSELKISPLWIVNVISSWSSIPIESTGYVLEFAVVLLTLLISFFTAFIAFKYSDIST